MVGRVWLSRKDGALGSRLVAALAERHLTSVDDIADAAVAVWLDGHDEYHPFDTERLLATLRPAHTLTHLVVVSSAIVYGAWPNNPVPLTEDAVVRPEFDVAQRLVALEQIADDWRRAVSGRVVTVLRPAITMSSDSVSAFAAALAAGMGQRTAESDPPAQFLHVDDLVSAIVLAVEQRLDGVRNVAPDGAIPGERLRALAGSVPRLRLPERANEVVTDLRWRFQRGPIPPGLVSYTRWPWLIANDRLVADGWRPTVTNEQAYVEGTETKWWTVVSPKRRQEVALVGAASMALGAVTAAVRAIRAARAASRVPR